MGGSLFGIELQASENVFLEGIKDRQVAFRFDDGLVTLEGDETLKSGATSELEFVTSACSTLKQAMNAVHRAAGLAHELSAQAKSSPTGELTFNKGQRVVVADAAGAWLADGKLRINDPQFVAKPQGTVGVPLARLKDFIDAVLESDNADDDNLAMKEARASVKSDLGNLRRLASLDKEDAELVGFITACHLLILTAFKNNAELVATTRGQPKQKKDGDFWRIFAMNSDYLKENFPALEKDTNGNSLILVHRDSPKSMFRLLHRTDFHSMYLALTPELRQKLQARPGEMPTIVWPWPTNYRIFSFPYRADPLDPDLLPAPPAYKAMGWPGDGVNRQEDWHLMEHGPTLTQWWQSVVKGQSGILKDLTSPPPGFQGRSAAQIAKSPFPGQDENKRTYYGMGTFPMDDKAKTRPPLAVYEHRALDNNLKFRGLGLPTVDKWPDIAQLFYETFVEPYDPGMKA